MATLDKPTLVGLTGCAVPVALFSAYSQFELGLMAGIDPRLAWVMPVATDAAAYVATRVWLDEKYPKGIQRYAASIVIVCVALSVAGAALHLGLSKPPVPQWLPFAVGAIPSLALAGLIHLGALIAAIPDKHGKASPAKPPRQKRESPSSGVVEPVRPVATTPASKSPAALTSVRSHVSEIEDAPMSRPEVGKGSARAQMLAYIESVNGETNGAELDRMFNTSNYGRGVLNTWRKRHPIASGE